MKHTPTPWEVETHNHIDNEVWHTILKGAVDITHNTQPHEIACDKYSALSQEENEANAAFIVRAVNNFYPMLEALKWCLAVIEEEVADGEHTSGYIIGSGAVKQAEDE